MKFLSYVFQTFFIVLMLSIAGLFLVPMLPIENNLELRIVESGSMEPSIMTGALVIVRPAESYQIGDVIMFNDRGARVPTTHRVVDTYSQGGRTWFVTKGDANEEADTDAVAPSSIIGTVAVDVPRVGYVLDFARQPVGFMFLIVLPACLIVLAELEKIWREIRRRRSPQATKVSDDDEPSAPEPVVSAVNRTQPLAPSQSRPMIDIASPVRYLVLPTLDLRGVTPYRRIAHDRRRLARWTAITSVFVFSVLVASSALLGSTVSYFNDIERSLDNSLKAIALDFTAVPDGSVYTFVGSDIQDDDGAVVVNVMPTGESVDVRYDVTAAIVGTSTELCDSIIADSVTPISYAGDFALLAAEDVLFDSPWSIAFSLGGVAGLADGDHCDFALSFSAWHYDEELDQGYFDEETVPLSFSYSAPIAIASVLAPQSVSVLSVSTSTEDDTVEIGEEEPVEKKEETEKPAAEEPVAEVVVEEVVEESQVDKSENKTEEAEEDTETEVEKEVESIPEDDTENEEESEASKTPAE